MDEAASHFFHHASTDSSDLTWIEENLKIKLPQIKARLGEDDVPPNTCTLADTGAFLIRILQILSIFADELMQGGVSRDYVQERLPYLVHQDDGSLANYIDEKVEALKSITQKLRETACTCRKVLSESPRPPWHGDAQSFARPQFSELSHSRHRHRQRSFSLRPAIPEASAAASSSRSESGTQSSHQELYNDTTISQAVGNSVTAPLYNERMISEGAEREDGGMSDDMHSEGDEPPEESIKTRGTGQYTCEFGIACRQGGFVNGQLKVFHRNSEYKTHQAKHKRPHICDVPGCSAKGFTSSYNLERHKQKKHGG